MSSQVRSHQPGPVATRQGSGGVLYHLMILGFFGAGPAVQKACAAKRETWPRAAATQHLTL